MINLEAVHTPIITAIRFIVRILILSFCFWYFVHGIKVIGHALQWAGDFQGRTFPAAWETVLSLEVTADRVYNIFFYTSPGFVVYVLSRKS